MRRNLRVNRLFVKMLLYFSSLLIPIIIIGSVTYGNYVTKFKNNFAEKMTLSLQFSSNTVDVYLRTLQEAGINFFHTVTVKEMLRPFSQYTLEERAKLNDIVISVKNTSNIVVELATNVFMFIDDKKVYTNQGVEEFDLFFNQLLVYDKYDENYWKDIDNRHPNQLFEFLPPAYQSDTQSWIKVVPLLVSSLIRGHQTHLVLNISVDMLQKTLEGNAAYKTTQFILMDSNQNIIVTTGPNPLEDSEITRLQAAFSDGTMSNQELELRSGSYMASYVRSEVYGWEFYSLTPLSEFYIEAKGILGMIVVMCAILIIIGFVFSFIFAYNLYNPIKNIRDILLNKSESSNEVSSSGNELEWISKGITQLIHYNQNFERQLDHVSREYIDHAFLHLLKDRTIPNEQVFQKTLEKKLQFSKADYVCCTIRMQFSDHFYEDIEESERLVIIGKLKNVIWGIFSDYVNLHILEYTQHFYVCIINVNDNEDDAILVNQAVTRFLQTFEYDSLYCIIHIGKGNVHTGLEGAAESYHESILALQYRKTEEQSEITHYEQLEIRHSIYFTFADELKILNGLKAGDVDVATIVDEMLTLYKQSQTGGAMIGTLITDIYRTGLRFLLEMDFDLYTFITEEQHRLLMETNEFLMDETVEKRVLLDFFERLSSAVSNRLKIVQKSDTHVSAIVAFITEKYEQELYLENISEQMGLSPKYVSRIFKEKTKMNISDYINMVRINKAKVLLSETDLAIYEISELVGITSRTTFLRVFKKTTGMSPREYRKQNNVQFKEGEE